MQIAEKARSELFSMKNEPTKKDIFDAQVTITRDITQYTRQISRDVTGLVMDNILKDYHFYGRKKKNGR